MRRILQKFPVYLLLLPVYFVWHNYNAVFGFIPVGLTLRFLFTTILLGGLCFGIIYLFTRSIQKTAVATFFILLFCLHFGAWHDLVKSITGDGILSSYKVILPLSFLILGLIIYYLAKHPGRLQKTSRYLTVLFVVFCAVELVTSFVKYYNYKKDHNLLFPGKPLCDGYVSCKQADSSKPDIYFFLFDAYTNNRILQKVWNYDNSYMTNWLTENGFQVIDNGRCNYHATLFSLSSNFNMNYVSKDRGFLATPFNNLKAQQSISNNETFCILQKENYAIRFLAPFPNKIENSGIHHYFDDIWEDHLYMATLPGRVQRDILWNLHRFTENGAPQMDSASQRKLADLQLTIKEVKQSVNPSTNRPPQFVYAHFMVTHEPMLFDSLGGVPVPVDHSDEHSRKAYPWQITYANKLIKDLVQHIREKNKKNTIIIVQGDHGFNCYPLEMFRQGYGWPNFNAFYFPDRNYSKLYDTISPVNTFRVLFNQYFCQNLKLLKDSSVDIVPH